MRILHVDTASGWRGGQNQVLLTACGMAARGHSVTLACRAGGLLESRARAAGLAVCALPFRGDLWPPGIMGLARILRQTGAEVAQLHDPHAVSNGLIAATLAGKSHLIATRRVDFCLPGYLSGRKYAACRRVIVVSRAIASVLEKHGLPADRLCLVYEGVPDRPPQAGGRAALGIPEGAPVVGNVAALTDHKDHVSLIEAAARVRARIPDVWFVIVGDGERRARLEALARERGLGERCLFTGFRNDLDRLLPAFTVFCLSSHLEGLGTSLLDAMAFGLPVVATAAGGIPEAVDDGRTGRVVPVRDPEALAAALVEVLIDPGLQRTLGAAGRHRFLERFTADRMVEATLRVYEEAG
jgi:glycosyltransferase involved in cell wall biosynthesis